VNVEISKRARRNSDRINARWARHGDDPTLYAREFLEAVKHLGTVGHPGTPHGTSRRPHLRRLLLEKSKCHVYFVVDEKRELLTIVDVWNGQRGRPPKL
jgi:hypothetical protein